MLQVLTGRKSVLSFNYLTLTGQKHKAVLILGHILKAWHKQEHRLRLQFYAHLLGR